MSSNTSPSSEKSPVKRNIIPLVACIVLCVLALFSIGRQPFHLGEFVRQGLHQHATYLVNSVFAIIALIAFFISLGMVPKSVRNSQLDKWIRSDTCFVIATVALIFILRWEFWGRYELDQDESQDLASAITLLKNPLYWQSADTMTHGPLISYVLTLPSLFGLALDYASARLVGLALMSGSLLALWKILTRLVEPIRARLFVAPAALSIAFTAYHEFLAYNGEHMTIFLSMLAIYIGVEGHFAPPSKSRWLNFLSGVVIGMVPFAKVQGIPIVFAAGVILIVWQWQATAERNFKSFVNCAMPFILGAVTPLLLTIAYAYATGLNAYVFHSYIIWMLKYSNGGPIDLKRIAHFFVDGFVADPAAIWVTFSTLIGFLFLLRDIVQKKGIQRKYLLVTAIIMFVATLFAVLKSGRHFPHYFLLLLFPGTFLNAAVWENVFDAFAQRSSSRFAISKNVFAGINALIPAVLVTAIHFVYLHYPTAPTTSRAYRFTALTDTLASDENQMKTPLHVAEVIRAHTNPDSRLTIWGWAPKYHVLTGLRQGTRDSIIFRVLSEEGEIDPYFLNVYLADLKASKPAVIVDATGSVPSYQDKSKFSVAAIPAISDYVKANYELLETDDKISIYVRKDHTSP